MIKLELSDQYVAIIGEALGSAPYKIAAPVIDEIQKQINSQKKINEHTNGHDKVSQTTASIP